MVQGLLPRFLVSGLGFLVSYFGYRVHNPGFRCCWTGAGAAARGPARGAAGAAASTWLRVLSLVSSRFGVQGSGLKVQFLVFTVLGLGLRVQGLV